LRGSHQFFAAFGSRFDAFRGQFQPIDDAARQCGRFHRHDSSACEGETGRGLLGEAGEDFGVVERLKELDLDDLIEPEDTEWQRESEDNARTGMEASGGLEGQTGAAEHSLQAAHKIVMGEQPERAGLGEAEAEFITEHRSRIPGKRSEVPGNGIRERGRTPLRLASRSCLLSPDS
jgi:hypothetical protein